MLTVKIEDIELSKPCPACHGGLKREHLKGAVCVVCDGLASIPTPIGFEVLDFIREHYKPYMAAREKVRRLNEKNAKAHAAKRASAAANPSPQPSPLIQ